ncbi:hypothetical protein ZWY2020_011114 [Hordeum vulgare]|nr:hypothetical protein ZWY2020_011114 [Hordeum vulgare]
MTVTMPLAGAMSTVCATVLAVSGTARSVLDDGRSGPDDLRLGESNRHGEDRFTDGFKFSCTNFEDSIEDHYSAHDYPLDDGDKLSHALVFTNNNVQQDGWVTALLKEVPDTYLT